MSESWKMSRKGTSRQRLEAGPAVLCSLTLQAKETPGMGTLALRPLCAACNSREAGDPELHHRIRACLCLRCALNGHTFD